MNFLLLSISLVLSLPTNETVRTDCFRNPVSGVPSRVAGAEVQRTEEALIVRVWRSLNPGEKPVARGRSCAPETMFADGGETVEMAIAPHADNPSVYYQFIANPSNEFHYSRFPNQLWYPAVLPKAWAYLQEGRWGAEFVVPYASLGISPPEDGDRWAANFASLADSWTGSADYHDVAEFGTLVFGGPPASATVESAEIDQDGTLHVKFAVQLKRKSGELPHKLEGPSCNLVLQENGKPMASFGMTVPDNDADCLTLDRFYYQAGLPIRIAYAARGFGMSDIRIRDLAGRYGERQFRGMSASGTVDVGCLPAGEYAFEIEDKHARMAGQFEVAKGDALQTAPCDCRYPIVGSDLLESRYLSFEKAVPYSFTRSPEIGYIFDRTKVLYGAGELLEGRQAVGRIHRIAYEAQLSVMLRDGQGGELKLVRDQPEFYAAIYRDLKIRFPDLRFSIQIDKHGRAQDYAKACDVLEYAPPICAYSRDLLSRFRSGVKEALEMAGGRPVIIWMGAAVPENGKYRTVEELNTAVRYCIMKGVSGNVLHLGHGGIPRENTRMWSFLKGCEENVNVWYSDWARGEPVAVCARAEDGIEYGMRRAGGRAVLIVTNFCRYERTFSYQNPSSRTERFLRVPGYGSVVVTEPPGAEGQM